MSAKSTFKPIAVLLSALLIYACTSEIVPATGERRYLGFSWQQEAEIGKEVSKQVAALFGTYRDPKVERYVADVGNRVLATSHLRRPGTEEQFRKTPVTFGVLDSPIINAMALPGGYIYVTRGMLAHLKNEDQLATVLAHEIGHVTARHAARQAWQQQLGQGLLLGGAILGQGLGLPAQDLLNLGGMAAQLIFLRYSREDELEADKLGVEYASAARYDAAEVIPFFRTLERLQEKEGQGMPSFLATHPNPGDRIQRIRELTGARTVNRGNSADSRYLNVVDGIVVGEDPRQGFVEENVFYHPELRFRFPVPRGFKVVNQPTQVVMVDGQNRAILGFTSSGEKSAEAAATKFANQPGLRIIERGRPRSAKFPAFVVVGDGKMQNGQVARVMAYFIEYRGAVYHFIGYTAPQAFGTFRNVFLQTMEGFDEVRDSRILDRQPIRLELFPVSRPGRFRDLVPRNLPAPFTLEEVAILNQVEPNQEIAAGTTLKFPRAG
ncbi:MAG TPA: M48 family metalloprotease [Candidatus Binatia bacterium]|nr:M48 family metalloprotease [Candidatus Binatia bacterium]